MATSKAEPRAVSVSQLTEMIKGTLETTFSSIWVEGEISDVAKPQSGHVYLTLKDRNSQIRGVIWRSVADRIPFQLKDGQAVLCFGSVDVYAARGSYQLMIKKVQPQGQGSLQLAFEQLQKKLLAEGLFDPSRKRPIPRFPKRIGFVTSPTGAAVRDFLEVARRRWPGVQIMVIPAVVQGNAAPKSIIEGIIAGNAVTPSLDVLVVGRGGGSLEDLWCFNNEMVVRAIAASTVPSVSAVGHEVDVTLADLVADLRALTPSAAAEMIVPDVRELLEQLKQYQVRLARPLLSRVEVMRSRLESLANRPAFRRPLDRVHDLSRRLDELDARGRRAIERRIEVSRASFEAASTALGALSPLATIGRGYSVTQHESSQKIVASIEDVAIGDRLITRVKDGQLQSVVAQVCRKNETAWTTTK